MASETTDRDGGNTAALNNNNAGADGATNPALTFRMAGEPPAGPWSSRKLRMLLCCAGAPFLIMLDTNIVAVSPPSRATFAAASPMSNG
jgi:hypothetical protein